ncbi:MAG: ABC transporter permease subunit, partial [candidate division KSB1 bacterium]|nr:ABC transporter permease subunit [candidate division KSB1 bacterium]
KIPLVIAAYLSGGFTAITSGQPIVIGSKFDTEGRLLGELMAQLLENRGFAVERRLALGATKICFEALTTGEIDVYPEYSGTIEKAILKLDHRSSFDELRQRLSHHYELELLDPFGFNNTYAIVVRRADAERLGLQTIGDLQKTSGLRFGFSHEFLRRPDGWPGLASLYGLSASPRGIEHGLIYKAIAETSLDVIDAYSTDANIQRYDLAILADDQQFFPNYLAAPLARADLNEKAKQALRELAGTISEKEMITLNAEAAIEKKNFAVIARSFLERKTILTEESKDRTPVSRYVLLLKRTITHIKLTAIALLIAMTLAIPGGVIIYRLPSVAKPMLYVAGLLQTIPSIALLAFMIPFFGIGTTPAIVALFLYALLPILRNTAAALFSIDPLFKKVAVGMGLTAWQRLRHIEMPLAAPTIFAGIKTAAVINIGTATLAAFIGAGGLGEPIVTGLALNDTELILEGAIPTALLAIAVEFGFEMLEKVMIPKHLLQKRAE